MRRLFIAAFLANLALHVLSLRFLPPVVAAHFGPDGMPNGWMSREANALFFLITDIVLFLLLWSAPALTFKLPPQLVNLPNRDYWLAAERKPETLAKLTDLLNEFGTAFFAFFLFIGLQVTAANLSRPVRLEERILLPALVAFLAYTAYWVWKSERPTVSVV